MASESSSGGRNCVSAKVPEQAQAYDCDAGLQCFLSFSQAGGFKLSKGATHD